MNAETSQQNEISAKKKKNGANTKNKWNFFSLFPIYLALLTELVLPTVEPLFETLVTLLELLTLFVKLDCCVW